MSPVTKPLVEESSEAPSSASAATTRQIEAEMTYLTTTKENRIVRSSLARRLIIVVLFLGINVLVFMDWKLARLKRNGAPLPIRGSSGMRPIGEPCSLESLNKTQHVINNRHAIVFDAGSTGSRVHVYEFQYCGPVLRLLVDEVFEEVKPGLSSYHANPIEAAKSLKPLLNIAAERVPVSNQHCTPLIVKATAGLRLLPEKSVDTILQNVRNHIRSTRFLLGDGKMDHSEAVSVMDGSEEGVFAWVTVNFLQERLRPGLVPLPSASFESSVVMDLGGGSTQIVFALSKDSGIDIDPSKHPEYYYYLKLLGMQVNLYQQSYLGYGLMEARKNVKQTHIKKMLSGADEERPLRFPCFRKGYSEDVAFEEKTITLTGDTTNWDSCVAVVTQVFRKGEPCAVEPCSFNGIHQPPIKGKSLIAFSYFFDRLIPLGLTSPVSLFDMDREGRKLCAKTRAPRYQRLLDENPQWCLDLAYIYSLLRVGYSIDIDQPIVITKQISGYEAGWSLGAALNLLEHAPACAIAKPSVK